MDKVESGQYVSVDYKGTLQDGEVFDTSEGRQPIEFQVGAGQMIQGFENAVVGMALNEEKTFTLEPQEAYGERDEELSRSFPRNEVPPSITPEVGMTVALQAEGRQIPATISAVDDEQVTVDLNHPLAGKALTFEIKVVGISDTPSQAAQSCGSGCDCASGCC